MSDSPRDESTTLPPVMREVDIEEHLGAGLDPSLAFQDQAARVVRLGDYFRGTKPIVLTLAYFRCPMLCGLVLRGTVASLGKLPFRLGEDYRALTVSFDPRDTPAEAAHKQDTTLVAMPYRSEPESWPFLVGQPAQIGTLADSLGFRFAYDERTGQYAHPAAVFVLTPEGRISRYLYGTELSPRDVRLALIEAASGKIGTIVDRILLTCYRFDPATRRFGPFIRGFMRIGGVMILAAVALLLAALFRAERLRRARVEGAP
jgi:protein SCO1/2